MFNVCKAWHVLKREKVERIDSKMSMRNTANPMIFNIYNSYSKNSSKNSCTTNFEDASILHSMWDFNKCYNIMPFHFYYQSSGSLTRLFALMKNQSWMKNQSHTVPTSSTRTNCAFWALTQCFFVVEMKHLRKSASHQGHKPDQKDLISLRF